MDDRRFVIHSWALSLAAHGAVLGLVLAVGGQVTPIVKEKVFKWEVALVQATRQEPTPKQAEVASKSVPVGKPKPEPVAQRVDSQQPRQMVQPVMEPVKPIEPKIEQTPVSEAKEPEPVKHAEPVRASAEVPPYEPTSYAVSAPSVQQDIPQALTALTAEASPVAEEEPMQAAAAVAPAADVKADHRWLAESLWRRVAELKRYPNSARMNGQEGKVILKAVIRSDGQLAEVSVQKSSGHSILDAAAMEAVKLACPLHMKLAIGKPQIVVSLPIVYSLAN